MSYYISASRTVAGNVQAAVEPAGSQSPGNTMWLGATDRGFSIESVTYVFGDWSLPLGSFLADVYLGGRPIAVGLQVSDLVADRYRELRAFRVSADIDLGEDGLLEGCVEPVSFANATVRFRLNDDQLAKMYITTRNHDNAYDLLKRNLSSVILSTPGQVRVANCGVLELDETGAGSVRIPTTHSFQYGGASYARNGLQIEFRRLEESDARLRGFFAVTVKGYREGTDQGVESDQSYMGPDLLPFALKGRIEIARADGRPLPQDVDLSTRDTEDGFDVLLSVPAVVDRDGDYEADSRFSEGALFMAPTAFTTSTRLSFRADSGQTFDIVAVMRSQTTRDLYGELPLTAESDVSLRLLDAAAGSLGGS